MTFDCCVVFMEFSNHSFLVFAATSSSTVSHYCSEQQQDSTSTPTTVSVVDRSAVIIVSDTASRPVQFIDVCKYCVIQYNTIQCSSASCASDSSWWWIECTVKQMWCESSCELWMTTISMFWPQMRTHTSQTHTAAALVVGNTMWLMAPRTVSVILSFIM